MGRKRGFVDRAYGPKRVATLRLVLGNVINLVDKGPVQALEIVFL